MNLAPRDTDPSQATLRALMYGSGTNRVIQARLRVLGIDLRASQVGAVLSRLVADGLLEVVEVYALTEKGLAAIR